MAEVETDTWRNDRVKMVASHYDHTAGWVLFATGGSVEVWIAPADLLLALKLLAGRGRRDGTDIDLLCDACAVTSTADAEVIFDRYYPHDEMASRARAQLQRRYSA